MNEKITEESFERVDSLVLEETYLPKNILGRTDHTVDTPRGSVLDRHGEE